VRWVVLLIASGCNQALGLTETQAIDAHPPPMCPRVGGVPTLYGALQQVPIRYCTHYTPSVDRSVALASRDVQTLVRGPLDHDVTEVPLVPPPTGNFTILPMPEGDRVLVNVASSVGISAASIEYTIGTDGAAHAGTQYPLAQTVALSRPSGGPNRRMVYEEPGTLVELGDTGAGFVEVRRYPLSELTTDASVHVNDASLSPDGLRLVFIAANGGTINTRVVYYTDRATTEDHFGPIHVLETAPSGVSHPYLTANCGRLYFSALDTVFYLE